MSYEYVSLLKRRSLTFMKYAHKAIKEGEYDIACFLAEQAVQLSLKALILRVLGYVPRVHRIRELLGIITKALVNDLVNNIEEFVRRKRDSFRLLEDAYIGSRYLMRTYDINDAKECMRVAEEVLKVVDEIEREIF